ncbi:GNAT superfamily N-acetyltransferase [Hydrogenophaga palleronii]|uniref:GNAT superfamily N-acetyltransferase n=1 Tax=Hydrogenophaga palleronii TaxID=65655 RepID=A0ABU1WNN3_9BURK|nr:GNAT family N-acetyltransferase [Hydrogenophaga palleronii]MDR7150904.1 GNAT superfamily N-acetyltransferase [Hydrogenophaga palleronii]
MIDLLADIHAYYTEGAAISREVIREHLVENLLSPSSPHQLVVCSLDHGIVIGFAAITMVYSLVDFAPEKRKHCQLKELYVRSSMRSKGAGRSLMSWVARHAAENGCHRIDWPVKASNAKGIAFYKGVGAEQVVERLSFRLSEQKLRELALQCPAASDA